MPHWIEDEFYFMPSRGTSSSVSVTENVRRDTGILNAKGHRIYKEANEIGFGRKLDFYSVER